jgi:hypothetical protein
MYLYFTGAAIVGFKLCNQGDQVKKNTERCATHLLFLIH